MPADDERRTPPTWQQKPAILWCLVCGTNESPAPGELLQYTRDGWPRCCDQVMSYFAAEPEPPETPPA